MKKFLFFVLFLALISGAGYWVWTLGSVPGINHESVELVVQEGGVQVKKPSVDAWESAESGMKLEKGWSVKTDASGLATIRFYHQGESRLDRNSEVVITEASYQSESRTGMKAEMELKTGRIWSRVLRLLDLESSYVIKASDVVATVRGTSFDLEKRSSGEVVVGVGESAVTVRMPDKTAKAIADGSFVIFSQKGSIASESMLTDEVKSGGWYVSNAMADQAFVQQETDRRRRELNSLGGVRPDSSLTGIVSLSERVHLALADDPTKKVLLQQYLSRRLYRLIELVRNGKTGLASQEFTRIENDLQAQSSAVSAKTDADYIRASVLRIAFLADEANPEDALYPFKQRIERLLESLPSNSELGMLYARLLAFDARLNESLRLIDASSFDLARTSLDGVKSGIENVRRDSASMLPTLDDAYRSAFEGKILAVEARQSVLRTRLDAKMHPMSGSSATTTEMLVGGSSSTTAVVSGDIASIRLEIVPSGLEIGQKAKLVVTAIMEDGSKQDVTAFAQFESMQYAGRLNGPAYTATNVGKEEIKALYQGKSASAVVKTSGEVKLVDLAISSSAGVHLSKGQRTVLTATARYNNGMTKNVTDQTVFTIVSGGGELVKTVFSNNSSMIGDTVIAATFKDGVLTSIGSIKISVSD